MQVGQTTRGEDKVVGHRYIDNKAAVRNIEVGWDFINALRPLFESMGQHVTNECSEEVKPRTFYHDIDGVCMAREGDRVRVTQREGERL